MLNVNTSTMVAKKLAGLIPKKIVLTDKKGNFMASTYSCSRNRVYNVKDDIKIVPIAYGGETVGYAYIDEDLSSIISVANAVKSMVELLLHQLVLSDNITSRDQRQDKFIYDILNSDEIDADLAVAEAKVFDIDLKRKRIVLTILVNNNPKGELFLRETPTKDKEMIISRFKRGIQRGLDSFYTRSNKNIIAYFGKNLFVILKDLGQEADLHKNLDHFQSTLDTINKIIKDEIRADITVGVGSFYPSVHGLGDSYKEAYLASQLGLEIWGGGKVFNIDDFGVVAPLLSGLNERNLAFSKKMLKKISDEDEMGKTIEVFLNSNMSLTQSSKILKIHRNTLVYRLDKITETLGLDPRVFDDAIQIKLALLFNQFAKTNEVVVK